MDILGPGSTSGSSYGGPKKISNPSPTEETQSSNRNVSGATDSQNVDKTRLIERTESKKEAGQAAQIKPESRPLGQEDIRKQLLTIQRPITDENIQILAIMLQHGVEANAESFDMIQQLIKGRKKRGSTVESAVISQSKGLSDSNKSLDVLMNFLTNQTHFTEQLKGTQRSLNQFQRLLQQSQHLFDKGLFAGLSAIVSEVSDELKKLNKKSGTTLNLSDFKRGELTQTFKLLFDFLGGIDKKLDPKLKEKARGVLALKENIAKLKGSLNGVLDELLTHFILSKDPVNKHSGSDRFAYFQLPNPMVQSERDIDLLIRREKNRRGTSINPEKTRIVLKFDTPELGEVTIIIDVKTNKLSYVFQTNSGETKKYIAEMQKDLSERMKVMDYDVVSYKTLKKKVPIKTLVLPTFNLDTITRIIAEA
jgi:hypothetical protein